MNRFFISALLLCILSLGANAQSPQPYEKEWRTILVEDDGTVHQVNIGSITKPNKSGRFTWVNRIIFKRPTIINGVSKEPALVILVRAAGNCNTRMSAVIEDYMISVNGKKIGENAIAKQDKMSKPPEGSFHEAMLVTICGPVTSI